MSETKQQVDSQKEMDDSHTTDWSISSHENSKTIVTDGGKTQLTDSEPDDNGEDEVDTEFVGEESGNEVEREVETDTDLNEAANEDTGISLLTILPGIVLCAELLILGVSVYLGDNTLMVMGRSIGDPFRLIYESIGLKSLVSFVGPIITIAICVGLFNALSGIIIAGTQIERDKEADDLTEDEVTDDGTAISTLTTRLKYGGGALTSLLSWSSNSEKGSDDEIQSSSKTAQTPSSDGGTNIKQLTDSSDTGTQPETTETTESPDSPTVPDTTDDVEDESGTRLREKSAAYQLVTDWLGDDTTEDTTTDINLDEKDGELINRATERIQSRDEEMSVEALRSEVAQIESEQEKADIEGRTGLIDTLSERKEKQRIAVAPEEIEETKTYLTRTGRNGQKKYARTHIISDYPARAAPGWLDELFTRGINADSASLRISYHINPRDTSSMIDRLSTRVTRLITSISDKKRKGKTNTHEEQQQLQKVKQMRNALNKGETKLYDYALYMEVTSDSIERLNEGTEELKNHFGQVASQVAPLYDRQLDAQQAMAPLGTDNVKSTQIMDLESMGTTFPFVDPSLVQPDGVLMGFHQTTSSPVVVDRFEQSGHNMLISGKIGSGKSYLAKLIMWRQLLNDPFVEILIIDPVGGFGGIVDAVGGQEIKLGNKTIINPMKIREVKDEGKELESNPYDDKLRSLLGMFKSEFEGERELTKSEEGVLRRAIRLAYLSKGITKELETHKNESPTIAKVLYILEEIAEGNHPEDFLDVPPGFEQKVEAYSGMVVSNESGATGLQDAARKMNMGLEMFRQGSARDNLNGETNVKLQERIVQFDISNIADGSSESLYMHIILDWLFQRAKSSDGRTVVNIDEAHYMLGQEQSLNMLNLFARHSRHYNSGLTLISQTVDEFMNNTDAKEIYDQCDIRALMRHEDLGNKATDALGLNQRDVSFVQQAQAGNNASHSECLLYATEGGKMRLNIKSNDYEHHVVEEDLDEHAYAYAHNMITKDDMDQDRLEEVQEIIAKADQESTA